MGDVERTTVIIIILLGFHQKPGPEIKKKSVRPSVDTRKVRVEKTPKTCKSNLSKALFELAKVSERENGVGRGQRWAEPNLSEPAAAARPRTIRTSTLQNPSADPRTRA